RDPLEVADAVTIRIEEAAQVDLVDHRAAPPGKCAHALKGSRPAARITLTQTGSVRRGSAYVCGPEYVCDSLLSNHSPRMIYGRFPDLRIPGELSSDQTQAQCHRDGGGHGNLRRLCGRRNAGGPCPGHEPHPGWRHSGGAPA